MSTTANIHSFQTAGTVDGPGIRFVAFFQGCPLRCAYCHNPDTWDCTSGTAYTPEEIVSQIIPYLPFYKKGGVTLSGGEPLQQADFLLELLPMLRQLPIHIALDTSGCFFNEKIKQILTLCDLILLDLKFTSEEDYQTYTHHSMAQTLQVLDYLEEIGKDVIIRHVVVPTINDQAADILRLQSLLAGKHCVKEIELLPFRKLCLEKYQQMEIPFPFGDKPEMQENDLQPLRALLHRANSIVKEIQWGSTEYQTALTLRNDVLRKPLSLNLYDEDLNAEKSYCHIGAFIDGVLVGCLVLVPMGKQMQMKQVAVREDLRRQGIGTKLIAFGETLAIQQNVSSLFLHARAAAVPFYQKLQYQPVGNAFTEIGIKHWKMEKILAI